MIRFRMADGAPGTFRVFEDPVEEISLHRTSIRPDGGEDAPWTDPDRRRLLQCLAEIQDALNRGLFFAGALSYEAGVLLQQSGHSTPARSGPLLRGALFRRSHIEMPAIALRAHPPGIVRLDSRPLRGRYRAAVSSVRDRIEWGEVYQANYTFPVDFRFTGDADFLFAALYHAQPACHAAELVCEDLRLLSLSPELFFSISSTGGERLITCRPMKGTAPRTGDAITDERAVCALRDSSKERAENAMIVDLIRNDIGRLCSFGSVSVSDMFHVESLPRVFQMTGTVTGRLRADAGLPEIFAALLPSGSVTGAPKCAAISLLDRLEGLPRGFYTGAIGWASATSACWNVPIRTIVLSPDRSREASLPLWRGSVNVGSGITIDSRSGAEFRECMDKLRFFREAVRLPDDFFLYETILFRKGRMVHLAAHMERLRDSAQVFHVSFQPERTLAWIDRLAGRLRRIRSEGDLRLHIRLKRNGRLRLWITPLPERAKFLPRESLTFVVSGVPVSSADAFLYHKTSVARHFFDRERKAMSERWPECKEVLFVNEKGELTEGSYTSVFVELDGRWFTPPVSAGLLPGVERARLIRSGRVRERTLSVADLERAGRVILGNSVRGLCPAHRLDLP